jgi:DNA gyrase subunit A
MAENTEIPITERIENIHIEDEMSSSYMDYSMSVIIGRALPDVRDGLKPVHRRVLFAMREMGNSHNKAYKKSARVVGDVMGKYHPHGDQAIYDTMVRMAQDFSLRYMLVDGQGNFGSIDGDPPAAMRYTEVRMDRLAEELLDDIDKKTVAFGPNYDESLLQPLVLPAKFPNLLLNGSTGIAVGMATNIPPHNLTDLTDVVIRCIDEPEVPIDDLIAILKGPDFPTGGIICGTQQIENMYRTGRGQMRVRGRATIEESKTGKQMIIITEIPYNVNKTNLIETIARLVTAKSLEGISGMRDESNSEGIRLILELKRGVIPKVVLNNVYKHTQLQTTFGAILLAIDDGQPKVMNLKEIIRCFIAHRLEVVTKRTEFDLAKAEARAHILEGLKIALDNLDAVVKVIRKSKNRDEARMQLIAQFGLTEIQASAILEMRLYQLTGLERNKVESEYLELIKTISYLRDLLANEFKIYDLIKGELIEIKDKYGDARRTDIVRAEGEMNIEDLVADTGCIITTSHAGYIKRVPIDTYKAQKRGGKGVAGMGTKDEDFVEHLFVANTHDYILFFTENGRVYWEKVYEIPESGRTAKGKAIVNLLSIQDDEKIAAMIKVREFSKDQHLVMCTERGVVKKTNLADYGNPRVGGIIGINIDEGDKLLNVKMTGGDDDVMLITRTGISIRFAEKQLRDQGRATRGVRGISLRDGDVVDSLDIVSDDSTLLVCTENGYGKRTEFGEYRSQTRGGKGIIAIRTSERNGVVVGAHSVKETDALMLITANGIMIKMQVDDVRVIGRATQGVRLINLGEGDKLVAATTVEPEDESLLVVEGDEPVDATTAEPEADTPVAEGDKPDAATTAEPEGESPVDEAPVED